MHNDDDVISVDSSSEDEEEERSRSRSPSPAVPERAILKVQQNFPPCAEVHPEPDEDMKTLFELLEKSKFPVSDRNNVKPQDGSKRKDEAMCFGYYFRKRGGSTGRTFDERYTQLVNQLIAIVKKEFPDFAFTSIQVNKDVNCVPHFDKQNEGPSKMLVLGEFEGGRTWVQDADGDCPYILEHYVKAKKDLKIIKGNTYMGTMHEVKNRWIEFDAKKNLHFTEAFKGRRYCMVYFQSSRFWSAPIETVHELKVKGFAENVRSPHDEEVNKILEPVQAEEWEELPDSQIALAEEANAIAAAAATQVKQPLVETGTSGWEASSSSSALPVAPEAKTANSHPKAPMTHHDVEDDEALARRLQDEADAEEEAQTAAINAAPRVAEEGEGDECQTCGLNIHEIMTQAEYAEKQKEAEIHEVNGQLLESRQKVRMLEIQNERLRKENEELKRSMESKDKEIQIKDERIAELEIRNQLVRRSCARDDDEHQFSDPNLALTAGKDPSAIATTYLVNGENGHGPAEALPVPSPKRHRSE